MKASSKIVITNLTGFSCVREELSRCYRIMWVMLRTSLPVTSPMCFRQSQNNKQLMMWVVQAFIENVKLQCKISSCKHNNPTMK